MYHAVYFLDMLHTFPRCLDKPSKSATLELKNKELSLLVGEKRQDQIKKYAILKSWNWSYFREKCFNFIEIFYLQFFVGSPSAFTK